MLCWLEPSEHVFSREGRLWILRRSWESWYQCAAKEAPTNYRTSYPGGALWIPVCGNVDLLFTLARLLEGSHNRFHLVHMYFVGLGEVVDLWSCTLGECGGECWRDRWITVAYEPPSIRAVPHFMNRISRSSCSSCHWGEFFMALAECLESLSCCRICD